MLFIHLVAVPLDHQPQHRLLVAYSEAGPTQRVHLVPKPLLPRLARRVPPALVLQLRPRPLPSVLRPLPLLVEACSVVEPLAVHLVPPQLRRPGLVDSARLLPQLLALDFSEALRPLLRLPVSVALGPPAPLLLPICLALPLPA